MPASAVVKNCYRYSTYKKRPILNGISQLWMYANF